jgi:uncharacterized membrane protein YphA (DoxX/SURF4 family)
MMERAMRDLSETASRILLGVPLLIFGVMHIAASGMMAGRVIPNWPIGQVLVIASGLALIAAAASFLSGKLMRYAGPLLALELLVFIVAVHIAKTVGAADEEARTVSVVQILKDTMLAGGALAMAALAKHRESRSGVESKS